MTCTNCTGIWPDCVIEPAGVNHLTVPTCLKCAKHGLQYSCVVEKQGLRKQSSASVEGAAERELDARKDVDCNMGLDVGDIDWVQRGVWTHDASAFTDTKFPVESNISLSRDNSMNDAGAAVSKDQAHDMDRREAERHLDAGLAASELASIGVKIDTNEQMMTTQQLEKEIRGWYD